MEKKFEEEIESFKGIIYSEIEKLKKIHSPFFYEEDRVDCLRSNKNMEEFVEAYIAAQSKKTPRLISKKEILEDILINNELILQPAGYTVPGHRTFDGKEKLIKFPKEVSNCLRLMRRMDERLRELFFGGG